MPLLQASDSIHKNCDQGYVNIFPAILEIANGICNMTKCIDDSVNKLNFKKMLN